MPCYHPLPAWRTEDDLVHLREPLGKARTTLQLPCGGCLGCRQSRAREWAIRCTLEMQQHDEASFVTLTYDDHYLPPTLVKRHLVAWLKRINKVHRKRRLSTWRKANPQPNWRRGQQGPKEKPRISGLRFFASGEYGENNQRPHYHALIFGMFDPKLFDEKWRKGFTKTDPVTPERISYTAGYVSKKIGWKMEKGIRVDPDTGEEYEWQPPFINMSRRPGIGDNAKQYTQSWRKTAIWNGAEVPVPRFLHTAWKGQATEAELQQLAQEKLRTALERDTSTARLRAAEQIAASRHNEKGRKRKL